MKLIKYPIHIYFSQYRLLQSSFMEKNTYFSDVI